MLDEVVNLSKFRKSDSTKHPKSQTLFGTVADKENTAKEASINNGVAYTSAVSLNSVEETNISHNTDLSMVERWELQILVEWLTPMPTLVWF